MNILPANDRVRHFPTKPHSTPVCDWTIVPFKQVLFKIFYSLIQENEITGLKKSFFFAGFQNKIENVDLLLSLKLLLFEAISQNKPLKKK